MEFPLTLLKWCLFPKASDKVVHRERWSNTPNHLAELCLFLMDLGSYTFPPGNYMFSFHCAPYDAL